VRYLSATSLFLYYFADSSPLVERQVAEGYVIRESEDPKPLPSPSLDDCEPSPFPAGAVDALPASIGEQWNPVSQRPRSRHNNYVRIEQLNQV
jgi:hypothetical protein